MPSRKTPLKATAKPTPSCFLVPAAAGCRRRAPVLRAELGHRCRKNLVLVMRVLVPARPQDRLAQPRQAQHEQQRPDDDPQRIERDVADQRYAHDEHEDAQDHHRGRGALQRRAPAPAHAGGHDDGQGLDHLDQAGGEHGQDQDEGRRGVHAARKTTGTRPSGTPAPAAWKHRR